MSHPNPAFAWRDKAAMRRFVSDRGFATLAIGGPDGPIVVHLPVTVASAGDLHFHVARANRAAPFLDGALGTVSVIAADHYVSPDWYGLPDQVPTWNYVAVEVEGRIATIDEAALVAQMDALTDRFETALAPKSAWTRATMTAARFEAMLPAIQGYVLTARTWRGTMKLSQNKPKAARAGVADALAVAGRSFEASLVTAGRP